MSRSVEGLRRSVRTSFGKKKLEELLRDIGKRFSSPPFSSVDELLSLLDQTTDLISKVEQSPSVSVLNSLRPAIETLVADEFLKHSDCEVKLAVAACLSEITRITAPDAPYDDDVMEEVFRSMVEAFDNLDDISRPSFSKRVAILENCAKVRSCVVMLDLECDDLILEIFRCFFKTIRPNHAANIFSSMETIMSLILEESKDISQDLISCLLESVKIVDGFSADSKELAERVIKKCAMKLKPYFMKLSTQSLSEYSPVVASICQGTSIVVAQNENCTSKETMKTVSSPKHAKKSQVESLEDGLKTSSKRKRSHEEGEFKQDKDNADQKQQDGDEKEVPSIYHRLDGIVDLINQMQMAQQEPYHGFEQWQNHVDANFQTIASNQKELLVRITGKAPPLQSPSFFNTSSQPRRDDPPKK